MKSRGLRRRTTALTVLALLVGCGNGDEALDTADSGPVPGSARLSGLLGAGDDGDWAVADRAREFSFPEDHGPHPAYRNEWWYVTGNLNDESGGRFGFELTIFRFSLTPVTPAADSDWRTNQLYVGHLAVTDAAGERFLVAERYSRGALGLAGARAAPFRVWLEDWSLGAAGPGSGGSFPWRLAAADGDFGLELTLDAAKPPVLNGEAGLSRKSADAGNASYYYSMPRLRAGGRLRIGDRSYAVSGDAWLDREWSSSALSADQAGWDWFALQFDDGTELMFYQLRRNDGSRDPMSSGTYVDVEGRGRRLGAGDVRLEVTDTWQSPRGGTYPARWRMRVPRLGIDLVVEPVLADQELDTTVRYWEGAVDVRGAGEDRGRSGRGYVELTGYDREGG